MANKKISEFNEVTSADQTDVLPIVNLEETKKITKQNLLKELQLDVDNHKANKANPHEVTATQIGLGNVDDTSDLQKPISLATQNALNNKINNSAIGSNNGVAGLDSTGKVPASQLPSYVDDVLIFPTFSALPTTGENGKIYVTEDTNTTYRWGGTAYVEISASLSLGETSETAYRGDRGKTAYDHSQITSGNPHNVTKTDVGLSNVPNLDTTDSVANEHTHSNKTILDQITEAFTTALKSAYDGAVMWITTNGASLISHLTNTSNPHNVTKAQIGLGSVDDTSDENKPISTAQQVALNLKADKSSIGVANGIAELDNDGKVPSSQLPSYVDDVLVFANLASFPLTGESGKIYVAEDTNITYRWSGSSYVEISASLALGETSSTAYRGDRGKIAYDHSQLASGNPHNVTKADVGLSNVPNLNTTNAVNNEHTHSNKSILDAITSAFTTALKNSYDYAYNWVLTNRLAILEHLTLSNNPHNTSFQQVTNQNPTTTNSISVGHTDYPLATIDKQVKPYQPIERQRVFAKALSGLIVISESFFNSITLGGSSSDQYLDVLVIDITYGMTVTFEYTVVYTAIGNQRMASFKGIQTFKFDEKFGSAYEVYHNQYHAYDDIGGVTFAFEHWLKGGIIVPVINNAGEYGNIQITHKITTIYA